MKKNLLVLVLVLVGIMMFVGCDNANSVSVNNEVKSVKVTLPEEQIQELLDEIDTTNWKQTLGVESGLKFYPQYVEKTSDSLLSFKQESDQQYAIMVFEDDSNVVVETEAIIGEALVFDGCDFTPNKLGLTKVTFIYDGYHYVYYVKVVNNVGTPTGIVPSER